VTSRNNLPPSFINVSRTDDEKFAYERAGGLTMLMTPADTFNDAGRWCPNRLDHRPVGPVAGDSDEAAFFALVPVNTAGGSVSWRDWSPSDRREVVESLFPTLAFWRTCLAFRHTGRFGWQSCEQFAGNIGIFHPASEM